MTQSPTPMKPDGLSGHYSIVHSPDDKDRTGKGFYAELWWDNKTSPLYDNSRQAQLWAEKNGGRICHVN